MHIAKIITQERFIFRPHRMHADAAFYTQSFYSVRVCHYYVTVATCYTSTLLQVTEQTGDPCANQRYMIAKHNVSTSWRQNVICENLGHHLPATLRFRSANGCVVRVLDYLPTANTTHVDETRRVDGSVHDAALYYDHHHHHHHHQLHIAGKGRSVVLAP